MKYIDHIAYPIMVAVIYALMGFVNWEHDPEFWSWNCRVLWITWALAWGFALRLRILKEQGRSPVWMP
jgi:hypothetical protein